jgi:Domain of unknown function (DUF4145)
MKQLNLVEIATHWGYRTFELYHGDITKLDFKVDVLAISAFSKDYDPDEKSVIGALWRNCQIDVQALSERREIDLVDTFGCWVAKAKPNTQFERIVCAEVIGRELEISAVIENLFVMLSILEMKGVKIQTLALPVLASGNQQQDPAVIIKELLDNSLKYMNHSLCMKRILFVEKKDERARQLDEAMNEELGRVGVVLPKRELFEGLRKEVLKNIGNAKALAQTKKHELFNDARRLIASDQVRSFELGIISRRLVEFIVDDISPSNKSYDLMRKIEDLKATEIAEWIKSYMHVLRIFGNESAHDKLKPNRRPPSVTEADMALCLFCLQRVLQFWVEFKEATANA